MKKQNLKNTRNSVKPNRVSTFYLYEVNAIPIKIRTKYKKKLLKRKNARKQKNVKLLKYIYSLLKKNNLHSWDNSFACKKAGFKTINQLYWYKAKILNDLREMYFGWEEIEKKIKKDNSTKNHIEVSFIKAEKMFQIGMNREAKKWYLKQYVEYEKSISTKKEHTKNILKLFQIYRRLMTIYANYGNLQRFNIFFSKFKTLYNNTQQIKFNSKDKALIDIYHLQNYKRFHSFFLHDSFHVKQALECEENILSTSIKNELTMISISSLYNIYSFLNTNLPLNKTYRQKSVACLNQGYLLAEKYGYNFEKNVFRIALLQENLNSQNSIETLIKIKRIYKRLKKDAPVNVWTLHALNLYIKSLLQYKENKCFQMLNKLDKKRIIRSHLANAMHSIYSGKTSLSYIALQYDCINKECIVHGTINLSDLKKHNEMSKKMIAELRNIHFGNEIVYIQLNQLHSEFLKGRNFDFDTTSRLLSKIEWTRNNRKIQNDILGNYFELLKLGLLMFEESLKYNAKTELLNKFLMTFSHLCEDIIKVNNKHLNLIQIYLIITFIVQQINYPELWDIVYQQWDYLKENHPTLIKSLYKQLEKQKRQKAA